ncbi:homocysteine S-methyltransferase [Streptomyces sp. TRM43335]|uniref:Homocysteine S-methyltransferase n=1 Tax=Streptomyces taklimakanensis TaxID=2569853 RepID=A0A6G2BGP8_9ACTN|nr:homocysteine S-methyltransferase [Streptomyces taklimakanensis]MTE21438.1 homocysteine S-methyltransferase [Streptomyces taklimakanensis]
MTPPAPPLADALAHGPVVLDGGLSNQLQAQGCDLSDDLWSARLLADDPAQVRAAHTAYLRAGARVLITAGYQVSYRGFARRGLGRAETDALLRRSVTLARAAARHTAAAGPVWVAASVGPYGAVLADGSEYRGRYGLSVAELERFHRPRVEALAEAGPDVLALETVPDVDEAEALLRATEGCGVPVWLSYTVAGERTRAGQPLADAFAVAAGNDRVVAVGVNCCDPRDAARAVRLAVRTTGKPAVVYPNSGEGWDARSGTWTGPAAFDPADARRWVRDGARLVGGCCRVGPEDIARVARAVERDGRDRDGGRVGD